MKMNAWICVCLFLGSCSSLRPSQEFLQTDRKGWNRYLDEKVTVHFDNLPIQELPGKPPFETLNAIINLSKTPGPQPVTPNAAGPFPAEADDLARSEFRVTLHAEGITRREALRRISEQTGLKMTWALHDGAPHAVLITVR